MSAFPLASATQLALESRELHSKAIFYMDLYVKICLFPYFLFFLVFKHDFIRCIDVTVIAASNTASDDVTN